MHIPGPHRERRRPTGIRLGRRSSPNPSSSLGSKTRHVARSRARRHRLRDQEVRVGSWSTRYGQFPY